VYLVTQLSDGILFIQCMIDTIRILTVFNFEYLKLSCETEYTVLNFVLLYMYLTLKWCLNIFCINKSVVVKFCTLNHNYVSLTVCYIMLILFDSGIWTQTRYFRYVPTTCMITLTSNVLESLSHDRMYVASMTSTVIRYLNRKILKVNL
jgi:hypothetical protein